jgi:hypothetical protein
MSILNTVDLNELANGALKEKFDEAWAQLIENVIDPNVATKNARTLTIKITVKPNGDRNFCSTGIQVSTSLPATNPVETAITVGTVNGKPSVREYTAEQSKLEFN